MLSDAAEADGKTLKDMFGSVEAGSAAMVLARNDGADYNEMLTQMQDCGKATDEAFQKVTDTTKQKFAKALNEAKNALIDLMDKLLPSITQIIKAVTGIVDKFSGMDESTQQIILTVGGLIAALGPVLIFIGNLTSSIGGALKAAPEIVSAVAKVKGAVSGLGLACWPNTRLYWSWRALWHWLPGLSPSGTNPKRSAISGLACGML